jgi:hypothetical protein
VQCVGGLTRTERTPTLVQEGKEHELKVRRKIMFDVSKAKKSVTEAIHFGFQKHLVWCTLCVVLFALACALAACKLCNCTH